MKPFNLKNALNGHPVIMRDGTKIIKIIDTKDESKQPIKCNYFDLATTSWYTITGKYYSCEDDDHPNDLSECTEDCFPESDFDLFMDDQSPTLNKKLLLTR